MPEPSSFDRVYRGILRMLYEGRLVPGERLIAPRLAGEFGAARNTIREVLGQLCAIGVITMVRNQSPRVRVFSRSEMQELLDVVSALLCLAAHSAATSTAQAELIGQLEEAYLNIRESERGIDLSRFVQARERYYRTLLQIGGNRELIRVFPTMHVHLMRLQLRSIPLVAQSAQFGDYAAIHEAVLLRDPDSASQAARQHVKNMADAIRNLPNHMFANESKTQINTPLLSLHAEEHD